MTVWTSACHMCVKKKVCQGLVSASSPQCQGVWHCVCFCFCQFWVSALRKCGEWDINSECPASCGADTVKSEKFDLGVGLVLNVLAECISSQKVVWTVQTLLSAFSLFRPRWCRCGVAFAWPKWSNRWPIGTNTCSHDWIRRDPLFGLLTQAWRCSAQVCNRNRHL